MTHDVKVEEVCKICKGTGKVGDSHVTYECPVCDEKKRIASGELKVKNIDPSVVVIGEHIHTEAVINEQLAEIPVPKRKGRKIGWRKKDGGTNTNNGSV